jgi:hypothetical protein
MRMRRHVVVAITLGLIPLGCSLLTSLDGLSGAPVTDATLDGTAAESGIPDAGGDSDAPPVSGEAGEAGPIDPCTGAIFCDHFERADVQGSWGSFYTDNGGTAAINSTTFTSATRSLMLHVPSSPAGGDPHAQLGSIDYGDVAHVRVAFSLKVGVADRQISLMRLQLNQSDRSEVFDLFMLPGKIVASEQGFGAAGAGYFDYAVPSGFLPDVWQRWTLELDARGSASTGIVTLDGNEVIRKTLQNAYTKSVLGVLLGAYYAPNGPPHDVFYDDVSITILP